MAFPSFNNNDPTANDKHADLFRSANMHSDLENMNALRNGHTSCP